MEDNLNQPSLPENFSPKPSSLKRNLILAGIFIVLVGGGVAAYYYSQGVLPEIIFLPKKSPTDSRQNSIQSNTSSLDINALTTHLANIAPDVDLHYAPFFSEDGRKVFWSVETEYLDEEVEGFQEYKSFINNTRLELPSDTDLDSVIMSPDGKNVAYVRRAEDGEEDTATLILNDKKIGTYREVWDLTFSFGGQHFAYLAEDNSGDPMLVVDGKKQETNYGSIEDPHFSPDNRRVAYKASQKENLSSTERSS